MKKLVLPKSGLFKTTIPIIIIFILTLTLLRSFLNPGFPETHDGQLYLARMANFHLAVKDGHFPVRWAPNLNYKFGYPVFHFNYYTPYILSMVPKVIGADFETSFKLTIFVSLFTGGLFIFLFLKKKFKLLPALLAALVYVAAPYQMLDIFVRLSIGEIVALGVLPVCLYAINCLTEKPNRFNFLISTISIAFFALTHNIIFFFSVPVLFLYSVFASLEEKKFKLKPFMPIILSFALAFSLTLFFWAPALMEKKYTNIDQLPQMQFEYQDHFLNFGQMVISPWDYGYSYAPPKPDEMSLMLGPVHWIIAVIAIGLFISRLIKKKPMSFSYLFYALVFCLSVFAMLPISNFLWKIIPFVRYVQFPWRLLTFTTLATAGLTAFLAKKLPRLTTILAITAIAYTISVVKPGGWFDHDNYFYYEFPFNTSIMSANTPKWFNEDKNIYLKPGRFFDLKGIASLTEVSWKTQKHVYQIDTPEDTEIMDRTTYFPGWQAYVDGQKVPIDYQKNEYPGIITFKVPAGKHLIETRFTENTIPRKLGNTVSILALVALGLILETKWFLAKK